MKKLILALVVVFSFLSVPALQAAPEAEECAHCQELYLLPGELSCFSQHGCFSIPPNPCYNWDPTPYQNCMQPYYDSYNGCLAQCQSKFLEQADTGESGN